MGCPACCGSSPASMIADNSRVFTSIDSTRARGAKARSFVDLPRSMSYPLRVASVKILVIDPDPATQSVLSAALDGRGYEITTTPDGEQGLQSATGSLP